MYVLYSKGSTNDHATVWAPPGTILPKSAWLYTVYMYSTRTQTYHIMYMYMYMYVHVHVRIIHEHVHDIVHVHVHLQYTHCTMHMCLTHVTH